MADETIVFTDPLMIEHDPGAGHPERPDRLRAVLRHLDDHPPAHCRVVSPTPATDEAILRVHTAGHLERIEAARGTDAMLDPDTIASPRSVEAARLAAGAATDGVDALMAGEATRVVSLVRPPGHHARPQGVMGFCLLNNAAIAAAHASAVHGLERILVVDWDVHHGNGTQDAFYGGRGTLVFNTHQFPFYPGTGSLAEVGRGAGEGYTVNVPLPAGTRDGDFRHIFDDVLAPIADRFDPQLVIVSAGFDAHRADPLGQMELTAEGFADLCARTEAIAKRSAAGRILLTLEGGYDLGGLVASVDGCLRVLGGETAPDAHGDDTTAGGHAIAAAVARYRAYWPI